VIGIVECRIDGRMSFAKVAQVKQGGASPYNGTVP